MRGTVKISANLKPRFVNPQIKLQNGNAVETKSDAGTFYTQYEEKDLFIFYLFIFYLKIFLYVILTYYSLKP